MLWLGLWQDYSRGSYMEAALPHDIGFVSGGRVTPRDIGDVLSGVNLTVAVTDPGEVCVVPSATLVQPLIVKRLSYKQ